MEKKKYDLCREVLRRLKDNGILDSVVLVGSWCIPVYEDYFKGNGHLPPLRTREVEFLFPIPFKLQDNIDLFNLLKDLGFILSFKGDEGYIIFDHPDLILEFLVPARGKESNKPFPIQQLGINAQALRFMDALAREPIQMIFEGIKVTVPHPADFALHKLLVARRRKNRAKAEKDRGQAVALLEALIRSDEMNLVAKIFIKMPKTWQSTIKRELKDLNETNLLALISGKETA